MKLLSFHVLNIRERENIVMYVNWNNPLFKILTFLYIFYKSMPDFPMDSNNGNCRGASIGKYILIKPYNKL